MPGFMVIQDKTDHPDVLFKTLCRLSKKEHPWAVLSGTSNKDIMSAIVSHGYCRGVWIHRFSDFTLWQGLLVWSCAIIQRLTF